MSFADNLLPKFCISVSFIPSKREGIHIPPCWADNCIERKRNNIFMYFILEDFGYTLFYLKLSEANITNTS